MTDLERMCRALAAAEGLDPDQQVIPRKYVQEWRQAVNEHPCGWLIPTPAMFEPAWQQYRGLAEAALAERREDP